MPLFEFDEELVFELLLALLFEVVAWDDCLLAAELFWVLAVFELLWLELELVLVLLLLDELDFELVDLCEVVASSSSLASKLSVSISSLTSSPFNLALATLRKCFTFFFTFL